VRFVRRAEGVTRRADALGALVHGRVDPAETVLVEGDAGGYGRVGLQPCSKSVARPAPGRVELDVHCPGDAFAVCAERADRGWEATVDGVRAPLVRSYGLVLGLPLHRGAHRVVLRYRPPGFRLGMALAAATALTLAAGMVSERGSPGG